MEELEKTAAGILDGIGKTLLLERIAKLYGPHAKEALRNTPHELEGIYRLLKQLPSGGSAMGARVGEVAPGFTSDILNGRQLLGGMELNALVPKGKQYLGPPVSFGKAAPAGALEKLLASMGKHPVATAGTAAVAGAALSKLLADAKRGRQAGLGSAQNLQD